MRPVIFLSAAGLCLSVAGLNASAETLRESLAAGLATNPQLEAQRYQAAIANETIEQARAQGRTQVSLSGSAGVESTDTNSPFAFNVGERPTASAQIQASKPIYTGGRIAAGIRQAEYGFDAASADLESTVEALIFEIVSAYEDVRRDRETLRIRQNNVAVLQEQVRAANDRFDVGVVTRTDVALASARLEGAIAAVAGAEAQLEASLAQYAFLVGEPPKSLLPPPPIPPLPVSFEAALDEALAENPSLTAARAAERAASEAVRVAEAAGKPQVNIVGIGGYQETFDENIRSTQLQALAQGSVPIFTGGLIKSQVRSARLQRRQARQQIDLVERQLRAQVAQAWYRYEASLRAIEASERQVEAAEIAYEGAKEELSVGVRTTLDVLDQEQQLFEARLAVVSAERDSYVAAHALLDAIGTIDEIPVVEGLVVNLPR